MDTLSPGARRLVVGGSVAAVLATLSAIVLIPSTVRNITSARFLPHVYCYMFDKKLIALHLGSDGLIWLSYVSIALTLAYLVWRTRREIPYSWMLLAFGTFIIACGFTHFMEMVVLWRPVYWLAGDVKLVTALASVVTAIALPPLVPQIQGMVKAAHVSEDRRHQVEWANQELQRLSAHLLSAQDGERRRLARDLHDGVGQYLAAMRMSFEVAVRQQHDSGVPSAALRDCKELLEHCTKEVRTISHLLHPPLLDEMGLTSAIPWYASGFSERSGIEVKLNVPDEMARLPEAVETVLFRVLQESLTNIHRHSQSKIALIRMERDPTEVRLIIADQGKGLDRQGTFSKVGVGVAGMRERLRELGGELKIRSDATGTTVTASVPVAAASAESAN